MFYDGRGSNVAGLDIFGNELYSNEYGPMGEILYSIDYSNISFGCVLYDNDLGSYIESFSGFALPFESASFYSFGNLFSFKTLAINNYYGIKETQRHKEGDIPGLWTLESGAYGMQRCQRIYYYCVKGCIETWTKEIEECFKVIRDCMKDCIEEKGSLKDCAEKCLKLHSICQKLRANEIACLYNCMDNLNNCLWGVGGVADYWY